MSSKKTQVPKVNDLVKVTSGPEKWSGGGWQIKGHVMKLFVMVNGSTSTECALVKVPSGGEWGFHVADLTVVGKS